jgi:drug/metabolite transporter (DMT)-like permease
MLSLPVMLAVLLGAALHATWNVGVRAGQDRRRETALVVAGACVLSVLTVPFLPQPRAGAWPYLAASATVHVGYFTLVAAAYARGSVALAYPLMRGAAPALTAVAAWLVLGETLPPLGWLGIGAVCGGVLLMTRRQGTSGETAAARMALANALVVAAYTLIDGVGVRASAAPLAYTMWLFILTAAPSLLALQYRRGRTAWRTTAPEALRALGAGACSIGSYALALWAMTHAPVAPVAALRETAMLFGLVLARVVLGERPGARRWAAAGAIAAGAALLRLA